MFISVVTVLVFNSVVTVNSLVRSLELGEYEGRLVFISVLTIISLLRLLEVGK